MNILLTKKIPSSELDLIRSWGWNFETIETLNIIPLAVNEIPKSETWIVSSRNSFSAIKKFIKQEPGAISCIGNWMKEELEKLGANSTIKSFANMKMLVADLAKQNFKSILYFCGDEHRPELEEELQNSSIKISKVITHQSQLTFPIVTNEFDAVFVFSPRSAESLLKNNLFNIQTLFACIGSTTANYLSSRGIKNTFTPSYPDTRILLEEFHNQILNIKS